MLSTPVLRGLQEIGPYQILDDLGPAPFGTAYLAVDTRSDHVVMLKVIPPSRPGSWQEAASWEILLAETQALARIYHPGIPSLFEVAEHEGVLLVSFAQTEGRSLHELLVEGQRPDRALLVDWGCQLLEILEEAHAEGVLHRHLGEEEVIVAPEGILSLTGFGLTQLTFDAPPACAPESLDGEPCTVQSDLYAVGLLLRRLAFAGALKSGAFGTGGSRDPLLKVLARATCPDPASRYGSAREMAEALREAGRAGTRRAGLRRERRPPLPEGVRAAPVRLATPVRLPAPASRQSRAGRQDEEGDLWRALLLLVVTLLLMAFLIATGWFMIDRDGSPLPEGEASPGQKSAAVPVGGFGPGLPAGSK
jgi:serine/threonine protein kinase